VPIKIIPTHNCPNSMINILYRGPLTLLNVENTCVTDQHQSKI